MLVTFLLVPATIDYVDSEVYGIWLTLSAILMMFQILDIGIASGLKNKLTEALAAGDMKSARSLVSTSYVSMAAIFIPIVIIIYALVPYISWCPLLNVDIAYEGTIVQTMRILAILLFVQMIANIIVSVLAAYQRVALSLSFLVIGNILAYILDSHSGPDCSGLTSPACPRSWRGTDSCHNHWLGGVVSRLMPRGQSYIRQCGNVAHQGIAVAWS